jgi:hypothetical protein
MVIGTPVSALASPFFQAAVARSASARAEANISVAITLQRASVVSSAAMTSSITSRGVKRPER